MKKTILFFGGSSDERLVSTASAQNLSQQFPFQRILFLSKMGSVHEISQKNLLDHKESFTQEFNPPSASEIAPNLKSALPQFKDATVFMGFHGTEGENGEMQALFEEARVFFTGSGSVSSKKCFDKVAAKKGVAAEGILVTEDLPLDPKNADDFLRLQVFFGKHKKIVLKPTANGSSIGLFIVASKEALEKAMEQIRQKPEVSYLAEKFMEGRECTIGILQTSQGLIALPASEVVMQDGLNFDYNGKYLGQGSTEITPAPVTAAQMKALQDVALKAHQALQCVGYSRTDVILCANGDIIYLETNTLPGLTKASFIPQQLTEARISMPDFIQGQLNIAQERYS